MFYVVELPWGFHRPPNLKWDGGRKVWVYEGDQLPAGLAPFRAPEFSRQRWIEDDLNKKVSPVIPGEASFTPKPHQVEAAKKIARSYDMGWSAFLLADKTGIGKTLSGLAGIALMAKNRGFTGTKKAKVLVVCPKGVIAQWRQTIRAYKGSHVHLRIMVINYQQLSKLLKAPAATKTAKRAKTKRRQTARDGSPTINFDYVVFDEAHKLKNYPSSNTSLAAVRIAQLDKPYEKDKSPFVIFSTATPGSTPLNLAVMSGFLSRLIKPTLKTFITPAKWGDFLILNGFEVKKTKSGYSWVGLPWASKDKQTSEERAAYQRAVERVKAIQRKDTTRIGKALTSKDAPFIMRSPKDIAGWPEQQVIPVPVELTNEQKVIYNEAWSRFRKWLRLTPPKSDPKGALVEQLRYRQKTSILRTDTVAEMVVDWVEEGKQVYISCEFMDTIDSFREHFKAAKIPVAEISGRTTDQREQQRLLFQKGKAPVVLSTVVEGISLHAGETLPDGTKATNAERITVIADLRQNPLDAIQTLGRAHRDGQNSLAYIPYIEKTVDERIVDSFINKVINTEVMTGKKLKDAVELEDIFRKAASEGRD